MKLARATGKAISIESVIHTVRGEKVILDVDLARIYGVTTKRLNEQVKRNARRFPSDFACDCYWLYVVTDCNTQSKLQDPIKDPARFPWHEVKKVEHYYLSVDALTQPKQVKDDPAAYGPREQ